MQTDDGKKTCVDKTAIRLLIAHALIHMVFSLEMKNWYL